MKTFRNNKIESYKPSLFTKTFRFYHDVVRLGATNVMYAIGLINGEWNCLVRKVSSKLSYNDCEWLRWLVKEWRYLSLSQPFTKKLSNFYDRHQCITVEKIIKRNRCDKQLSGVDDVTNPRHVTLHENCHLNRSAGKQRQHYSYKEWNKNFCDIVQPKPWRRKATKLSRSIVWNRLVTEDCL